MSLLNNNNYLRTSNYEHNILLCIDNRKIRIRVNLYTGMEAVCSILRQSIRMKILRINEGTKNKKKGKKDRKEEGRYIHIHTFLFSHQYIHKCEFI